MQSRARSLCVLALLELAPLDTEPRPVRSIVPSPALQSRTREGSGAVREARSGFSLAAKANLAARVRASR
eukprot:11168182-Lingulodinium_polyedra.AAC.1